jgi:hypothetical protein
MGSVEVFQGSAYSGGDLKLEPEMWYWWQCQPGCLPDGEPNGPFPSEEEAWDDAHWVLCDQMETEDYYR